MTSTESSTLTEAPEPFHRTPKPKINKKGSVSLSYLRGTLQTKPKRVPLDFIHRLEMLSAHIPQTKETTTGELYRKIRDGNYQYSQKTMRRDLNRLAQFDLIKLRKGPLRNGKTSFITKIT